MSDGAEGAEGAEGEGQEGAEGQTTGTEGQSGDTGGEPDRSGKPEWMGDRVWDEKFSKVEGELNMEEVAQHYAKAHENAENLLHTRKETLKGEIEQEVKSEMREGVPESANDYIFNQDALAKDLGLEVDYDKDDPILIQYQAWAHQNNLTQDQFDAAMDIHLQALTQLFPDWDQEMEKLGEHAEQRAAHLNTWLSKVLSPDSYRAFEKQALSADLIVALEELQEAAGVVSFSKGEGTPGQAVDKAELMKLMDTDEYRNGDPATLQKVEAGFKRIAKSA